MTVSAYSSLTIPPQLQATLRRWFNFHRVLWVLTLVSFFIAWNRGLALLYGLFSLLTALLAISYLLPSRQLRNISVARQALGEFTAGKTGRMTYHLEADGIRYHVELRELLEFAEKKEQYFFFNRISGRTGCKLQFHCAQRGCFRLQDIQLASAYPFGIVRFSKVIQTEPSEILVFPRVFELSRIPMPMVADTSVWGDVPIPHKGGRDEYTAVREYSQGDELSRIHWRVSARHQKLVVREYEKTDRPALLVVLDCRKRFNLGEGSRSTFEFAVSIAASMIRFASREGMQCFLAARSDRWHELTIQAHRTDLYPLYELLARITSHGDHPYPADVEQAHRRFPQANLITTFRLNSDAIRPELSPHITQIDLEMDEKSFCFHDHPDAGNQWRREGNRLIYTVDANLRLETLFQ